LIEEKAYDIGYTLKERDIEGSVKETKINIFYLLKDIY
jgi:hypothetical protein